MNNETTSTPSVSPVDNDAETKEAMHRRYYDAFHAWFMQSGCDFWNECDAPEYLATIAVEMGDAALREAQKDRQEHDRYYEGVLDEEEAALREAREDAASANRCSAIWEHELLRVRMAITEFLDAEAEVEKEAARVAETAGAGWSSAPTVRRIYAVKALTALAPSQPATPSPVPIQQQDIGSSVMTDISDRQQPSPEQLVSAARVMYEAYKAFRMEHDPDCKSDVAFSILPSVRYMDAALALYPAVTPNHQDTAAVTDEPNNNGSDSEGGWRPTMEEFAASPIAALQRIALLPEGEVAARAQKIAMEALNWSAIPTPLSQEQKP